MLRDNLKALHLAAALTSGDTHETAAGTPDDLKTALRALASMISRAKTAKEKFSPGTSQHTLQQNRLEALHLAKAFVAAEVAP